MRGSRKFCLRGSNFDLDNVVLLLLFFCFCLFVYVYFYSFFIFFLVDEGRKVPNTTISGPSLACQRNAIKMAFRWRADDGPTLNAGLVAL